MIAIFTLLPPSVFSGAKRDMAAGFEQVGELIQKEDGRASWEFFVKAVWGELYKLPSPPEHL